MMQAVPVESIVAVQQGSAARPDSVVTAADDAGAVSA